MVDEQEQRAFCAYWDNRDPNDAAELPPMPEDALGTFAVTGVSDDGHTLSLPFVLRAGERYCCQSIGCMEAFRDP